MHSSKFSHLEAPLKVSRGPPCGPHPSLQERLLELLKQKKAGKPYTVEIDGGS